MRIGGLLFLCALPVHALAQPLIDLVSANALVSHNVDRTEFSASIPVRLDTIGKLLIMDPYWVQWRTTTNGDRYTPERSTDVQETMRGAGGALTFIAPFGAKWKLAVVGIVRYHWLEEQHRGDIQPGGVLLASRSFSPRLTLRSGVYTNHDAFGLFVMPLFGVDWRIDARHNLYGVLPGSLTFEHKVAARFHWGASFRAYTTSFGLRDGDYRRINENPLGLYGDLYATKQLVLRVEGGWCFVRRVLGGPGDPLFDQQRTDGRGYAVHGITEAPYIRVLLAYRLRLDGPATH